MSGEIKRFDSIKNMAVFQDFQWAKSVNDQNNKVCEFGHINILYAHNYSLQNKPTIKKI